MMVSSIECSPDQLVVVEEGGVLDSGEGCLQKVHKTLNAQVRVFVEGKKVNTIDDIEDVCLRQLEGQQVLSTEESTHTEGRISYMYYIHTGIY